MNKAVRTVPELWQEWTIGFDGGPSVQAMDDAHGQTWRGKNHALGQFYSMRRTIINEVKRKSGNGPVRPAINELEQQRKQTGEKSLDWLAKQIRASQKAAERSG